ncbi:LysR family transcriptional regulator [Pseudoduganella umbonata]|uniref:DNA-binding transcriptional LysR family regulator n=1 Tax=Pseudoduganella umbonata TaxID=864828 RepID=A0A4P8HLG8_9BURK|nr:LysR family transcriptional regulator [Pseudoduganella umbonata]MBB3221654.1 DNA-binding transcriptional LysR family regulator [Pseudoduganella umbonata]QCP09118.1 LysR family transcriptional regulator [Pseudoduganella umbonata]
MAFNTFKAVATFAQAVELGSIRQAALAQGITSQAASQAIAQLEQDLGVRLLHRTTRRLSLTEEGRCLLENSLPALAALDRSLALVRGLKDDISGPLRIVGPKTGLPALLMPVLDEFCRSHPGIQPEVQLDDSIGNWVQDRVDIGFRIGPSPDKNVIGRRLLPVQMIICAAPRYLEIHGVPASLDELAQHRCSVYRHATTEHITPWFLKIDNEVEQRFMTPAFSTNEAEMELQAVLAGLVIGQLANFSAASHIRAGRLIPVLVEHVSDDIGLYVYYGSRTSQPRRVRAFLDLVLMRLKESPDIVLSHAELHAAARR